MTNIIPEHFENNQTLRTQIHLFFSQYIWSKVLQQCDQRSLAYHCRKKAQMSATEMVLELLKQAKDVPRKRGILFSKSGFTDSLQKIVKSSENMDLVKYDPSFLMEEVE